MESQLSTANKLDFAKMGGATKSGQCVDADLEQLGKSAS